ncbi:MAG: DUF86 domain-containing protein [Oscillospiraceae bacterium]|nr:DUF86 domain-containing protein [Oscillospiraceae bacterium]
MMVQDNERFKKMYTFAKDASSIAEGITLERLTVDKAYQYSLLYPLGQIGEIAINMGSDIPELYPAIEWSKWRGFRNRIFHDYGTIDFSIVFEMITEALSLLLIELQKIHEDYHTG